MRDINKDILNIKDKIKKLEQKELYLLDLNKKLDILKIKYPDIKIEKVRNSYCFISDIYNYKDKKPYLLYYRNYSISYYEKVKDIETDCFIYSVEPKYGTKLVEFSYPDSWFDKTKYSITFHLDFFEILKSRKSLIKKVQKFVINNFNKHQNLELENSCNSDNIQRFIDNLIFI